jgi:hypothetical protein
MLLWTHGDDHHSQTGNVFGDVFFCEYVFVYEYRAYIIATMEKKMECSGIDWNALE